MGYSVELLLDPGGDAAVRRLWSVLDDIGVPSLATATHGQHVPHVSLTVCDDLDVDGAAAALADTAETRAAVELFLGFAGVFAGPPPVVFAGVVSTDDLLGLQAAVRKAISPYASSVWEHYLPNRWVPHCTLAMPVDPARVGAAVEAVLASGLPVTARAVAIGVAEIDSGDVRMVAELASP